MKLTLNRDVQIFVTDDSVEIRLHNSVHRSLVNFPWRVLFDRCAGIGAEEAEAIATLVAQGYPIVQVTEVIESLKRLGVLTVESPIASALNFHRQSSFGKFSHLPTTSPAASDSLFSDIRSDSVLAVDYSGELRAPLSSVLSRRFSTRKFSVNRMEWSSFVSILDSLRSRSWEPVPGSLRHSYPSAGGIYAVSVVIKTTKVANIGDGVWLFDHQSGVLCRLAAENIQPEELFYTNHIEYSNSRLIFFLCVDLERIGAVYGERAYRYALLEGGHIAQNILLTCAGLDLGAISIGGFRDDKVTEWLSLRSGTIPIYALAVGAV